MAQVVIHSRTQFIQSVLNIDLAWAEAEIEKRKENPASIRIRTHDS